MAITGVKRQELTIESVLERISALDIFNYYMPIKNWDLNKVCISPFPRNGKLENSPSFIIGNKYGDILFKDFGGEGLSGDCFEFVKQLNGGNLSLDSILRLIARDFGLDNTNTIEIEKKPITQINKAKEVNKRNTLIQVITRSFTTEELQWWSSYYQTEEDLKQNHVYSIKKAFLNKKPLNLEELRFAYLYENKYWKLYQPNANKRQKWLTNCPLTIMDGLENIKDCDTAFITKSKKDLLVAKKIYNCVAASQNESLGSFSQENIDYIKNNSKKQVILFDADYVGVYSCTQITNRFNMNYWNVPKSYLEEDIKDISDLAKAYGLKKVEELLKIKGFL